MLAAKSFRLARLPLRTSPSLLQLPQSAFISTTNFGEDSSISSTSTSSDDEFQTGHVKFYKRDKFYGFIAPVDKPNEDVFVQRRLIVSDFSFEESPKYPFLRKGDYVRFKLSHVKTENGEEKLQAAQVTFANGKKVPPLRPLFLRNTVKGIREDLGKNVYTIMKDTSNPEEQWQRVQDAWNIAQSREQGALELIRKLGMNVDDFAPIDDSTPSKGDKDDEDSHSEGH